MDKIQLYVKKKVVHDRTNGLKEINTLQVTLISCNLKGKTETKKRREKER